MSILSNNHWTIECFKQRITTKEWKIILLNRGDEIVCCGRLRKLKAKNLGCGIVEVYKEPN